MENIEVKFFGRKVKKLRLETDLSISKSADKIGVSKGYLSRIERGGTKYVNVNLVLVFSKYYKVSVEYLIDDNYIINWGNEVDKHFIRNYHLLSNEDKIKIRKILEVISG